jgi:hypothetical protein
MKAVKKLGRYSWCIEKVSNRGAMDYMPKNHCTNLLGVYDLPTVSNFYVHKTSRACVCVCVCVCV